MPFSSSSEMLAWLSQNLLVNPQQVEELRAWGADSSDLHSLCKELLRRNWLTPYQISQLLKHDGETLVVGANRLIERLGEGAMGQVYRAWNVRLGRMVAVKMLHVDHAVSAKAMERFRREMQAAAALVHPNIVLLRDADEANNVPYLVMDYFDAPDLSRKMREEGPQPLPLAVDYVRQAAAGLQHAFEQGIVHRDIKPSNLLLVKTGETSYVVKILDFGLAKFDREEGEQQKPLTQAGRLIGTVDFVAPEQATDAHNADIRADIYSLGCTLFYFLTGKAPFPGADHLVKLSARIQGEPPPLSQYLPNVPPELEAVVLKMMARDPADRYQTPKDVVAALAPFCPQAPSARATFAAAVIPAVPGKAPQVPGPSPVAMAAALDGGFPFVDSTAPMVPGGHDEVEAPTFESPHLPQRRRMIDDEEEEAPSSSKMPIVIGLVAFLIFALGGGGVAYVVMNSTNPDVAIVPEAKGTMTIEFDNPPPNPWPMGERRPIIVKIKRQNFTGSVSISVDPLPDWLLSQGDKRTEPNKTIIAHNTNAGELYLTVKHLAVEAGPQTIRIVASSPDSQPAAIEYDMDIVRLRGDPVIPRPQK